MLTEYEVQSNTRICAATGRPLQPGEKIVSLLEEQPGGLLRRDFAWENWKGPPAEALAYWVTQVPSSERPAKPKLNAELLLDCFVQLSPSRDPNRLNFRYVLALLLMRRKRLKFEDFGTKSTLADERKLVLRDARSGQRYEVQDPQLSETEIAAVQDEIFRVLGWN